MRLDIKGVGTLKGRVVDVDEPGSLYVTIEIDGEQRVGAAILSDGYRFRFARESVRVLVPTGGPEAAPADSPADRLTEYLRQLSVLKSRGDTIHTVATDVDAPPAPLYEADLRALLAAAKELR